MAAAAGTALFRSMASKTAAPALRRAIGARGLHGGTSSGMGRSALNTSRLSTISGSSAASNEELAARDQKVLGEVGDHLSGSEFMEGTKDQIKATTNTCLAVLVFGTGLFYTFVNPKLNRLEDSADSLSREVFNLKQEIIKMKKDSKLYEAQSMDTSGPKSTS